MERWAGRVALVTGTSSGIGAAVAKELVLKGMKVVGVDRVQASKPELKGAPGAFFPIVGDMSKEEDILAAFEWTKKTLGGVDVLVNNAGLGPQLNGDLVNSVTENWKKILDLNVIGLSMCAREAIKSMQSRGVDGHIININSLAGHKVVDFPCIGMYTASKYAVTALSEALTKELVALNSKIKVTSISPGLVKTHVFLASGMDPTMALFDSNPHLLAQDVADSLVHILGTPPHVQIRELTLTAVGDKF